MITSLQRRLKLVSSYFLDQIHSARATVAKLFGKGLDCRRLNRDVEQGTKSYQSICMFLILFLRCH